MEQRTAAELSLDELVHAWNLGYAGYFVPMRFTDEMMRTHLRCGSVDLQRSRVWTERGEPAAFSFLGVRGTRAWIGGFAVTPAFRGRGLSYELFGSHVDEIRGFGLERLQLEVLTPNWARRTYERAGLAVTRTLGVLRGSLPAPPAGTPADEVSPDDALAELPRLHGTYAPAWNREEAWVRGALAGEAGALRVERDGRAAGALVWVEQGGAVRVLDGAAEPEAAPALVAALAARHPGRTLLLTNEPDGSPLHRALLAAGLEQPHDQYEMHLRF